MQVFTNLFDNVAKYTPPGTRVSVSAVVDGPFVRVLVEDDGPGLPPAIRRACSTSFSAATMREPSSASAWGLRSARPSCVRTAARSRRIGVPEAGARFEFTLPPSEPEP